MAGSFAVISGTLVLALTLQILIACNNDKWAYLIGPSMMIVYTAAVFLLHSQIIPIEQGFQLKVFEFRTGLFIYYLCANLFNINFTTDTIIWTVSLMLNCVIIAIMKPAGTDETDKAYFLNSTPLQLGMCAIISVVAYVNVKARANLFV